MKIFINEKLVYEISEIDKKCFENTITKLQLESRLYEIVYSHIKGFCEQTRETLKKEWIPILFKREKSIPTADKELLSLIFSQSDYKDADQKEFERKAKQDASFKVD